jgi:hypothetical protein
MLSCSNVYFHFCEVVIVIHCRRHCDRPVEGHDHDDYGTSDESDNS